MVVNFIKNKLLQEVLVFQEFARLEAVQAFYEYYLLIF